MWCLYLRVIRERCSNALNILDRFHIVAKMNDALDDVRAAESRKLAQDGLEPVLTKTRWCVLKRKENLTGNQRIRLRDLLKYNLASFPNRNCPTDSTDEAKNLSLTKPSHRRWPVPMLIAQLL